MKLPLLLLVLLLLVVSVHQLEGAHVVVE